MLLDLTHVLRNGLPSFPGDPEIGITTHDTIASTGYHLSRISMSAHMGTHLDAPRHFFDGARGVDQIELDRLIGPAHLIDFAPADRLESDTPLTAQMFQAHEVLFQPGARILYRTGWDCIFGSAGYFSGYAGLTVEAARWIASRRIGMLGMDTPSPSEDWKDTHLALLGPQAEIVIVEGLANLHLLPPRFHLIVLPLRLQGCDGSPVRAVADIGPRAIPQT